MTGITDLVPRLLKTSLLLLAAVMMAPSSPFAPQIAAQTAARSTAPAMLEGLEYRFVGPNRGGRSAAVTGVPGKPDLFYMGATGGGVFRTTDGGESWEPISDGFFGGSIGAVAVSEWDNNVIYVGGGEKTLRGNVSHGYGMWKSEDAGTSWRQIGLEDSRHIARVRIHPKNPDLVYAAAMGHLYGPNNERGVYRSKDGGASWERILFVSDKAGAVDLVMDPTNPRVLYASMWEVYRSPYELSSGGEDSGLWKSTDGGDTWTELTNADNGLPGGVLGIIGVTVSPVNPDRVWAIVEHDDGGVFRSENGGESWRRINEDRNLRQRAWYYTRMYAGTQDEDDVWVLNVGLWHSKDGGENYERVGTPHGDHHDFWIAPENADRIIVGDDGGAQVTYNGGDTWSTYHNQPTAQFYRVATDNHFPYRIYGGQQDNSTVRILHTSTGSEDDWESTAGGESAWIAPNPANPDVVFGGSYDGYLERLDHDTRQSRNVNAWPDNPMGHGAEDYKFRFQWNFPIRYARHVPGRVLTAANVLFKTDNEGQSWEALSPDLTRADPSTLGSSGGPITKDNTSVEYYATIFTFIEGEEDGVIWTGSDDGLIHITRDGGESWTEVTPPASMFPEWMQVNDMVLDPFNAGGLYVAGTRYKSDDFAPYLYKTDNYGGSWTKITRGIDALHFTRAIEADPEVRGLLYAGTESGMYVSFNDGRDWQAFQLNLPIVPITDLEWRDNDLVVGTQGRSFWIMDDLSPVQAVARMAGSGSGAGSSSGSAGAGSGASGAFLFPEPHPITLGAEQSVRLRYWLSKEAAEEHDEKLTMRILETDGTVIKTFDEDDVPSSTGFNQFNWNMRYDDAESFPGLIMWAGSVRGPQAVPGTYRARLIVGDDSSDVDFAIQPDPRSESTLADYQEQFDFLVDVRDKLTETHQAIKNIRSMRTQMKDLAGRIPLDTAGRDEIKALADSISADMTAIEEALYQTKNRSGQDPLNFPIRLNNKLAAVGSVVASGNYRPTDQSYAVRDELVAQIDAELGKWTAILDMRIPEFESRIAALNLPVLERPE